MASEYDKIKANLPENIEIYLSIDENDFYYYNTKTDKTSYVVNDLVATSSIKKKCKSSKKCNYIALMSDVNRENERYQERCCGECGTVHKNSKCLGLNVET